MPLNITAETPTAVRKIAGVNVQVPQPYAEGHVVSAGEAQMLNQTLAENFSNNLRKRIEEYVESEGAAPRLASEAEAQAIVDEYATRYEPGVRQGGGGGGGARALTPVEVEVRNLATAKLKEILRTKGLKQKDIDFTTVRDQIIEKHRDALTAQAEKVVRAREKAAGNDDDILASVAESLPGVGSDEGAEEAAAA